MINRVTIELVRDKTTNRVGLIMRAKKGLGGVRISHGKDTGQWNIIETLECHWSDVDAKECIVRSKD